MTAIIAPGVSNTTSNAKPVKGDTLLVYLIDRSGSMNSCWEETIGGLNTDLAVQKEKDDGKTEATVYFFDGAGFGESSTRMITPFTGPLTEAIEFSGARTSGYAPNGSTPLYDAVGRMIVETKDRVEATDGNVNVTVMILTDGGNTDYHGYNTDDVKSMVEACQGQGWTFTYFGANQDAWAVSSAMGVPKGNTVNYSTANMENTMRSASMARSSHISKSKLASQEGALYATANFFADAGQTADDYK